ncbi:MAG: hypothetical protein KIT52_09015 [Anaerolineae bacterium]|nr:hypothetical protein [Anaerolineae bacterium]
MNDKLRHTKQDRRQSKLDQVGQKDRLAALPSGIMEKTAIDVPSIY